MLAITNIVVIGGIHSKHSEFVLELLRKALAYVRDHINAEAVVLLGDIGDVDEIQRFLDSSHLRYFVVSENHDEALSIRFREGPIIAFLYNPSYDESLRADFIVSGKGMEPNISNGVPYITCPMLCESPFKMLHMSIAGQDIQVEEVTLKPNEFTGLQDIHVHTQFAYCSENMEINLTVERGKLFGLKNMVFTEHSSHLYFERQELRSNKVFEDISYLRCARNRMQLYKEKVSQVRSDFLKIGLEVDCAFDGSPMLLEEDMEGWDLLIGAVHRLPCTMTKPQSYIIKRFLDIHELFLASGLVKVLAHPFRIFRRNNLSTPKELYKPLARLLAETQVAAEINFHANFPDEEFFRLCLEEGVKLALGSDAHNLFEVGYLLPHVKFLNSLGVDPLNCDFLFSLNHS